MPSDHTGGQATYCTVARTSHKLTLVKIISLGHLTATKLVKNSVLRKQTVHGYCLNDLAVGRSTTITTHKLPSHETNRYLLQVIWQV